MIEDSIKRGKVTKVAGRSAAVEVGCEDDACSGCKVSAFCSTGRSQVMVTAGIPAGLEVKPGDNVLLAAEVKGWFVGWMLLAGLPCLLILAGIAGSALLGLNDILTGSVCLGLLVAYYAIALAFRKQLNRRAVWEIVRKDE